MQVFVYSGDEGVGTAGSTVQFDNKNNSFTVGFPESAVKESIHRIEATVKHCG